ncbi:MAG: hypothetical protein RIT04_373 [Candidatus Parcubacteria bacterium]|jgi:glutamyl/glutaminyl-tRNA synthetase
MSVEKSTNNSKVVTRFAPSPTGLFHAGSYRTAVFAYLFARKHAGHFILRIEDTDKIRSTKANEDNIIESLKWLHLDYDAMYRQSERTEIYKEWLNKLITNGTAYISKETPKEPGGRTEVIRFKNPNKKVLFHDLIRGDIEFDTTELGDFVIAKSLEEPIFHFVVVLDDYLMGVTHVIRGEDHISNTPRQILIQQALGATTPFYAHLPLVLGEDRSKLSKRKGALPLTEYRTRGYLPEAVLNFISLLGWNPGTEQELFSLNELVQAFDLTKVQKGGAVFNDEKLAWFNKQYIAKLSKAEFISHVKECAPEVVDLPSFTTIAPLLQEKISSFGDIRTLLAPGGELAFMTIDFSGGATGSALPYDPTALLWKGETDISKVKTSLKKVIELLSVLDGDSATFSAEKVKAAIWDFASSIPKEQGGRGSVLWPMRYALSGQQKSPDPFIISEILGKDETLARLNRAYNAL